MPLILSVVRGPSGVPPERREITDGAFRIGRGPGSDWTLPDPDRVLSKRHCEIARHGGDWSVTDCSSNGTYLNGACLGPDEPHPLHDHDRLTIGAYEIEARLAASPGPEQEPDEAPQTLDERRLTGDPFPPDSDPLQSAQPGVALPDDFDPLFTASKLPENPFTASDHASDLHESFVPPRTGGELLPPDWDTDDTPHHQDAPPPAPPPPPEPSSQTDPGLLDAFAKGARMQRAPAGDPEATLRTLGAAFRAVVTGLRRMMIARAAVKGEFRIQQTMIRAAGNNPLKFSADDDDALNGLLGIGRNAGMTPERAIAEAFRDMRLHELAVASAMQQAVHGVLAGLDPNRIMFGESETAMDKALGLRKRAAWDAYRRLHADTMRALADDFDSVFGKSFVRAYEAALASISAGEEP